MPGPSHVEQLNPDFLEMLSTLSEDGVEYLLVGGHAVAAHGYVRATKDLDLLIRPSPSNAGKVLNALRRFGAPLFDLTTEDLIVPGTVFQIGLPPRRIGLLTSIPGIDFDTVWANRLVAELDGIAVPILGLRDLIRNKRAVGRPQDLVDADKLEEIAEL